MAAIPYILPFVPPILKQIGEWYDRITSMGNKTTVVEHHHHHDNPELKKRYEEMKDQLEIIKKQFKEESEKAEAIIKSQAVEFDKMKIELKESKIEKLEDLSKCNDKIKKKVYEICNKLPRMELKGFQICFAGSTGKGKSTLINCIAGMDICKTDTVECTTDVNPYHLKDMSLWDIPGTTDKIDYLSAEMITLFKSMDFVGIVCDRTINEALNLIQLFNSIGIAYILIINKMDTCGKSIESMKEIYKKQMKDIDSMIPKYFISASCKSFEYNDLIKRINDIKMSSLLFGDKILKFKHGFLGVIEQETQNPIIKCVLEPVKLRVTRCGLGFKLTSLNGLNRISCYGPRLNGNDFEESWFISDDCVVNSRQVKLSH